MKRIASIWLPRFATDRLRLKARQTGAGQDETAAVALVETVGNTWRVSALNAAGERAGVHRGQPLSDARAIAPGLKTLPRDKARERRALRALAEWAVRYSPLVAVDGDDGLIVDITGCAHLFGGEAGLADDMARRLRAAGFSCRIAMAPTRGQAWGLARYATAASPVIVASEDECRLHQLPVEALRLDGETCARLAGLGLRRIGDIAPLKRASLKRRFAGTGDGDGVLDRLDRFFGRIADPLSPLRPAAPLRVRVNCAEPLTSVDSLHALAGRLIAALNRRLGERHKGARRVSLIACRVDGEAVGKTIALARPSRNSAHMMALLQPHLERLDPGFGIDTMIINADVVQALTPAQLRLDGSPDEAADNTAMLIDRLAGRFGASRVCRLIAHASHIPERAQKRRPAGDGRPVWPMVDEADRPPRPFRLLERPEPVDVIAALPDGPPRLFVWRRQTRQVVRAFGPERIAPEWWREGGRGEEVRDYYQVEDRAGQRYWLFRAGLYQDPGRRGPPGWFMHGLFA